MGKSRATRHLDPGAALVCAEAFQRLAEGFLARIAEDVEEGTQDPTQALPRNVGDLVATATNLAFAVELFIKALLAELQIDAPHSHDLGKLYDEIPESIRVEIEKSYATRLKNWYGRRASITIAKGPANQPKWDNDRSYPNDLRSVLVRSGDVFSSWRYIYEFTQPDQGNYQFHHFEYGYLFCACCAMRAAIIDRLHNSPADPEL